MSDANMETMDTRTDSTQPTLFEPSVHFDSNSGRGALVIASSNTALGVVRSLGRHGIPVWVLGGKYSVAGVSRYARRTLPLQGDNETQQADFLIGLAKQHALQGWTLFPDSDKGAAMLARNHQRLGEYYRLTVPPWDTLRWAFDKRMTYSLAAELGIDYPLTFYPTNRADVETLEGKFPMILKPAHHQGRDRFSMMNGTWRADNRQELLALYDKASALADPSVIMIQDMIPGRGDTHFNFATLCQHGRVLACALVHRFRSLPIDAGSGTYAMTIDESEIETPSLHWLAKTNFTGLAEVSFKFDVRDGLYKLLDVNARAWGWHPMCSRAGVDFPYLMWRLAHGEPITPVRARAGVRWVRTLYDLVSSLQAMRRGTLSLREYLSSLKGAEHEMYAFDDLMPAVVEVPLLFKLAWRRMIDGPAKPQIDVARTSEKPGYTV